MTIDYIRVGVNNDQITITKLQRERKRAQSIGDDC